MRPFVHLNTDGFDLAPDAVVLRASDYATWLSAQALREASQTLSEQWLAEAHEAYREAQQRGYAEGLAAGNAEAVRHLATLDRDATAFLDRFHQQWVTAMMTALRGIVAGFDDAALTAKLTEAALADLEDHTGLVLRVAVPRVAEVRAHLEPVLTDLDHPANVTVVGDPNLDRQACVLESNSTWLPIGIETQLTHLEAALRAAVTEEVHETGDVPAEAVVV